MKKRVAAWRSKTNVRSSPLARNVTTTVTKSRSTICEMREYLDEIPCPCPIYSFVFNPGLPDTFSWAARMATLYERYRVLSCEIEYVPSVAATHAGYMVLAFDYDVEDTEPSTLAELEMKTTRVTSSGREPFVMRLDTKAIHQGFPYYYLRHDADTEPPDPHTYDFGRLCIHTAGDTATTMGRLYVRYRFEYSLPNLEPLESESATVLTRITSTAWRLSPWAQRMGTPLQNVGTILQAIGWTDIASLQGRGGETFGGANTAHEHLPVWRALRNFAGTIVSTFSMPDNSGHPTDPEVAEPGWYKSATGDAEGNFVSAGDSPESVYIKDWIMNADFDGTDYHDYMAAYNYGGWAGTYQDVSFLKNDYVTFAAPGILSLLPYHLPDASSDKTWFFGFHPTDSSLGAFRKRLKEGADLVRRAKSSSSSSSSSSITVESTEPVSSSTPPKVVRVGTSSSSKKN